MRVRMKRRPGRAVLGRLAREERGVSAVIVGISLVAIFGAAVLSIDAGNLWQSRRHIITGTDAGALAEAKALAMQNAVVSSCTTAWSSALEENVSDVFDDDCSILLSGPGFGAVAVEGRIPVDYRFAGILGFSDGAAYSMSAAMYGHLTAAEALRPIGLCLEDEHVDSWLAQINLGLPPIMHPPDDYESPDTPGSVVHHVPFAKQFPGLCGDAEGSWAFMDYEVDKNGEPGTSEVRDWLINGFQGHMVSVSGAGIGDCLEEDPANPDNDDAEPCNAVTGAKTLGLQEGFDYLIDPDGDGVKNPIAFPIVIYDVATGQGAGAEFNVVAYVKVRLWDYRVTGPQVDWFLDLEFVEGTIDGFCCAKTAFLDAGTFGIRLCDVDHDTAPASVQKTRCEPQ